ncbi:helix-turn-helix domain-containing protein [Chryseobacterium sp. KCF3-3]|uniref:helix-turn-helix domain-containing protein n=1 Tax=Chryseobacterium sp. KCF3-3 TaxID=3231511 RepID=UPI0038B4118E
MKKKISPDYKKIFNDIIEKKYPDRRDSCQSILNKNELSMLDVILLNKLIFGKNNKEYFTTNQKYKSYNEATILKILNYQKENKLNNTQLARYFNLSRNTVTKWKKIFLKYYT